MGNTGKTIRMNLIIIVKISLVNNQDMPASSKWPFDHPNGGHLTAEKVT